MLMWWRSAVKGKEAVVALHGDGEFFGEGCLTGQPLRLAMVAAVTECVIMRLDKAAIVTRDGAWGVITRLCYTVRDAHSLRSEATAKAG